MSLRLGIMAAAALSATCAHPNGPADTESWYGDDPGAHPLAGYKGSFLLTWQGSRMGSAVEELRARPDTDGHLTFSRTEAIVIRRGQALVSFNTRIVIETDARLVASSVNITRRSGSDTTTGRAERTDTGDWRVRFGDEPERALPGRAIPAELVPLLIASAPNRSFDGKVMLPGYGFALADLRVRPRPQAAEAVATRVIAVMTTPLGVMRNEIELTADGTVLRVHGGDGADASRTYHAALTDPFDPPEMVDTASIAVLGVAPRRGALSVTIDAVDRDLPPPLPGQLIIADGSRWRVIMTEGDNGDATADPTLETEVDPDIAALADRVVGAEALTRSDEVTALVMATQRLLGDDLTTPTTGARAALALGRGDCTAHASLFAALAGARRIPTRLVTGYRLDGKRLVRHRWALARIDGAWVAVDPTHGESPARPRLIGLAVHGASASEIAVVDNVAFAGMSRAQARFGR